MKVAIACDGNIVSEHFGRCEHYIVFEEESGILKSKESIQNPGHAPFFLPKFLAERGVQKIICKGIGPKAIALFNSLGIEVVAGVSGDADEAIEKYLKRKLASGESSCEHLNEG